MASKQVTYYVDPQTQEKLNEIAKWRGVITPKGQPNQSQCLRLVIDEVWKIEAVKHSISEQVTVGNRLYEVVLHPDPEDGGFWVECPTLPGCDSQGETKEEALEMIKDAIEGHLEILAEDLQRAKAAS